MSDPMEITSFVPAFGAGPATPPVHALLDRLGAVDTQAHITAFPDGSFHNYYPSGLSLFYTPNDVLDRVDLYNPSPEGEVGGSSRRRRKATTYQPAPDVIFRFPSTTVPIPPRPAPDPTLPQPTQRTASVQPTTIERPSSLVIDRHTTARTLVECFGEPMQKGGKVGWLDTYMEWEVDVLDEQGEEKRLGVLVELREGGGEGMSVWDRAGEWQWACLKVFLPSAKPS